MRKIGELKGKPIIEGNPNEIKKNQIHYKESDGNITLSERKGDNTLSSVTSGSGSGGGGGNAFQYFKIIDTNSDLLSTLSDICKVVELISYYDDYCIKINRYDSDQSNDEPLTILIRNSIAFKVICGDFSCKTNIGYKYFKGNTVKDKILYNAKINNVPEEVINPMLQRLDSAIQEITKEEYEAMITYKPE